MAGVSFGQCSTDERMTVLSWVAQKFNDTVSALRSGQCGCYSDRPIRGGSGPSNHASCSAIDCNTLQFPQGKRNMSLAQIKACRAIVAASQGTIRWGGDYTGNAEVDQQHFEILSVAKAKAFANYLKNGDDGDMKASDILEVRDAYYPTVHPGASVDRKLSVENTIMTAFNYGSVATRDVKALKELVNGLASTVRSLQTEIARLKAAKNA